MELLAFSTPGLGDASYVVVLDGDAIVVDPQRDVDRFLAAVEAQRAAVRAVFETHVHNDYVSGARALAEATGAELVLPAGSGAAFRFRPAFHREELVLGGLTVQPLHTPGHTPEHVSYVFLLEGRPWCVFSGGSLLVGGAGRTDLLGDERAESLARLQHGSIMRLAALPDDVALYPTHGPGSFCAVSSIGGASSTIGQERATNPVLRIDDADAFAREQLAAPQPYPAYYRHMAPLNLAGAGVASTGPVPVLDPAGVAALIATGAAIVDGRPRGAVAAGRIPGSWAIELGESFATWVGWLVGFGSTLVLVLDDDAQLEEARTALARVGYTDIAGVLWGTGQWVAEGYPTVTHELATPGEMAALEHPQVLDVRSPGEWAEGHVDGSFHRYLPDLVDGPPDGLDPDRPVHVVCGTGLRSSTAAGILADAGYRPVVVTGGGVEELMRAAGAEARPVL